MNKKITFVYSEDHDWVAMYVDGKMVTEGHSIDAREALECLDLEPVTKHVSQEWAENQGNFPENEKDCDAGLIDD